MLNKEIEEKTILKFLNQILLEETSKVSRNDYGRIQYKMDELESQIMETIKEFRKLEDTIPDGLKTISNGRMKSIYGSLIESHNTLKVLKTKIKNHKKMTYQQSVDEKSNK
jgi:esterase/lipase